MAIIEISLGQWLPFIQPGTETNPIGGQVVDTLSFTDQGTHSFKFLNVAQTLVISGSAIFDHSINHLSIVDTIGFMHSVTHGPHAIVNQTLGFGQFGRITAWELPVHTLIFTQTVDLIFAKGATNFLTFVQAPICNVSRNIPINQTLVLHSNGTGINPQERCIHYRTLFGPNSGGGA